jgi:hypothetical protein
VDKMMTDLERNRQQAEKLFRLWMALDACWIDALQHCDKVGQVTIAEPILIPMHAIQGRLKVLGFNIGGTIEDTVLEVLK